MKIGDQVRVTASDCEFTDDTGTIYSEVENNRWDWYVTLDLAMRTIAFKESELEVIE
ncbi:MAG: hypothetical protein NTV98_06115 [Candidatus Roizmanbacteria bacterium]|nr:hypothetical protein [Candidatus Roizmanbacteria bacterium]